MIFSTDDACRLPRLRLFTSSALDYLKSGPRIGAEKAKTLGNIRSHGQRGEGLRDPLRDISIDM